MKKKSLVAMGLAGVMTIGMCVPVLANPIGPDSDGSGNPDANSAETAVEITEPIKYKISIPASFATSGETTSAELSVSEFNIEPNAKVSISVTSSNITLTNENDKLTTWKKSLKVGSNEFTNIDFTNSAQDPKTIILGDDASDTGVKPAGKYSGKVTFSIAYTANPAS